MTAKKTFRYVFVLCMLIRVKPAPRFAVGWAARQTHNYPGRPYLTPLRVYAILTAD